MRPKTLSVKKDIFAKARENMVQAQLIQRGIRDKNVLEAMRTVPRHLFVEDALQGQAYSDFPLPIGEKQTISQPYMVALMTEALGLTGTEKVLEIGAGCGYQSAILSLLAGKVYSIERIAALATKARRNLDSLNSSNVIIKVGDGTLGWPEEAPFDAIIAAAAAPEAPPALITQLKTGGRLVMPIGGQYVQELVRIKKDAHGITRTSLGGCRFVKLVGKYGFSAEERTC